MTDLSKNQYPVKLFLKIEGVNITIQTKKTFVPNPIYLSGGVPINLTADDLQEYFDPENLEFQGLSKREYQRIGHLPEGLWRFSLQVLSYQRNSVISNTAVVQAWIMLGDPPFLDLPMKDKKLKAMDVQVVNFSWTPRQISPNSALNTEYIFQLYEIVPFGAEPNHIVQSTLPYYEEHTTNPFLTYGITEPMLTPGEQYAWRVQVVDLSGRDRYRNNGYSEVHMFQWGDACDEMVNVDYIPFSNHIRLSWTPTMNQTEFLVKYHSDRPGATVFTEESYLDYHIIQDLKPGETIMVSVAPRCGAVTGDWTEEQSITTPEVDVNTSGFQCGAPHEEIKLTGSGPLYELHPGEHFSGIGGWDFEVVEVESDDGGVFNGKCIWYMPMFNNAGINSLMKNVRLNEDYQMTDGEIVTVYNPDSPFVYDDRKDRTQAGATDRTTQKPSVDSTGTVTASTAITIENTIDTVYMNEEGKIVVLDTAGNENTYPIPKDENGENKPVTVTDSNGTSYVVGKDGEVEKVSGSSEPDAVSSTDNINFTIEFAKSENGKFGFDKHDFDQLTYYNPVEIQGKNYFIPWISVENGNIEEVKSKIVGEGKFSDAVGFKTTARNLATIPGANDAERKVTIFGNPGEVETVAYASKQDSAGNKSDLILGKLKVATYENLRQKLIIVPVNGETPPDINTLSDKINQIYNQAVAEWDVTLAENFSIDHSKIQGLDDEESGILASFPQPMRQFNRAYKNSVNNFDKNAYYIFLIRRTGSTRAGFMPFKRQFGYIFTDNATNIAKAIAHELGHGAFCLKHPSSELGFSMSDNLMDNSNGTVLRKYQWDYVHDPEKMVSWFVDDEDAAMSVCYWWESFKDYIAPDELDDIVDARLPLYNEVQNNYDQYFEDSKTSDITVSGFDGWSIRKASHDSNNKGVYLVDKVFLKLIKEQPDPINLFEKGIFMGKYTIEDKGFDIAIFSEETPVNVQKVQVDKLCKLVDNETIKVIVEDEYILISFFVDKQLKLTLQINQGGEDNARLWLKYLGVLVESPSWIDEVKAFWNGLWEDKATSCASGFCCTKCGRDLTITLERLKDIFPNSSLASGIDGSEFANLFNAALHTCHFNTCDRQAKLFAQIGHESAGFNAKVEGQKSNGTEREWSLSKILTYFKRTSGAKRHWFNQGFWDNKEYKEFITSNYYETTNNNGTHKSESSKDYYGVWNGQNQSQYHIKVQTGFEVEEGGDYKIYTVPSASKAKYRKNIFRYAYGGVLGNEDPDDDEDTEDGWIYRGKGAIQLTGKDNYQRNQIEIAEWFNVNYDLVSNPNLVATDNAVVIYSAIAYILQNVTSVDAIDDLTIDQFSALVNTGNSNSPISNVNGAEDRKNRFNQLKQNTNLFQCNED